MLKNCALLTIVRNEHIMLPIWLKYYRNHFDAKDIYIIHNKDQELDIPSDVNVNIEIQNDHDHRWMADLVQTNVVKLLNKYRYVLFVESDEMIIPLQRKNIQDYVECMRKSNILTMCTTGYNLIHNYNAESKLDLSKKILDQRSYVCPDILYNKPLITAQPLVYTIGFHHAYLPSSFVNGKVIHDDNFYRDEKLWLLHLKSFDLDLSLQRQKDIYANRTVNPADVKNKWGDFNRNVDESYVKKKFFDDYLINCFELPKDFPKVL